MFKHTPLSSNFSLVPPAIFPSQLYMLKRAKQNKAKPWHPLSVTRLFIGVGPTDAWAGTTSLRRLSLFLPTAINCQQQPECIKFSGKQEQPQHEMSLPKCFPHERQKELLGLGPNCSHLPGDLALIHESFLIPPFLLLCVWNLMVWL